MNENSFRQLAGIKSDTALEQMAGSSEAQVYRVGKNIYKVGSTKEILKTVATYESIHSSLPKSYDLLYPRVETVFSSVTDSIVRIDYAGSKNMEDVILSPGKAKPGLLAELNENVLTNIKIAFMESRLTTQQENLEGAERFLEELVEALELNLSQAGISSDAINMINKDKQKYIKSMTVSALHKDLTVGNIMISDDGKEIKFIDPRSTIPQLGPENSVNIFGSVAFDLIGYRVSLMRKSEELGRISGNNSLDTITAEVDSKIREFIEEGIFSEEAASLIETLWYSVYAACKCDYCLAPQREWLYKIMTQQVKEGLEKI